MRNLVIFLLAFSFFAPQAKAAWSCQQTIAAALLTGCTTMGIYFGVDAHNQQHTYERELAMDRGLSRIATLPISLLDREVGESLADALADVSNTPPDLSSKYILIGLSAVGAVGAGVALLSCPKK